MMTGFAELEETIDAINRGQVFRFLLKPWQADDLLETSAHAPPRPSSWNAATSNCCDELRQSERQAARDESRAGKSRRRIGPKRSKEAYHELEHKNKMLEKLALTDPLTNLPNRRAMDRLAERELRRRDRYPGPLAIGMIDVDHFKADQRPLSVARRRQGADRSGPLL